MASNWSEACDAIIQFDTILGRVSLDGAIDVGIVGKPIPPPFQGPQVVGGVLEPPIGEYVWLIRGSGARWDFREDAGRWLLAGLCTEVGDELSSIYGKLASTSDDFGGLWVLGCGVVVAEGLLLGIAGFDLGSPESGLLKVRKGRDNTFPQHLRKVLEVLGWDAVHVLTPNFVELGAVPDEMIKGLGVMLAILTYG